MRPTHHGEVSSGLGVLRWQVSFDESSSRLGRDVGIPEPQFEIRDRGGHPLSWSLEESGSSGAEADGAVRVEGVPDSGELEVEVTRLVSDAYAGGGYGEDDRSYEGPWTFRFSL